MEVLKAVKRARVDAAAASVAELRAECAREEVHGAALKNELEQVRAAIRDHPDGPTTRAAEMAAGPQPVPRRRPGGHHPELVVAAAEAELDGGEYPIRCARGEVGCNRGTWGARLGRRNIERDAFSTPIVSSRHGSESGLILSVLRGRQICARMNFRIYISHAKCGIQGGSQCMARVNNKQRRGLKQNPLIELVLTCGLLDGRPGARSRIDREVLLPVLRREDELRMVLGFIISLVSYLRKANHWVF